MPRYNKKVKDAIENLCILMMVSDDNVDDEELIEVSNIINDINTNDIDEDNFFVKISLINRIKNEIGLENAVNKFASNINVKDDQLNCIDFMYKIRDADGHIRSQEEEVISLLKEIWKL